MDWKMLALAAAAMGAGCASGPSSENNEPVRALLSGDAMLFVSFDADGDLLVSQAEIEAGIAREWARADANGDGTLTPIEFQSWGNAVLGGGHIGPYRLDFDRNVDNAITRQEVETELRARADEYDENGDDMLSRGEFVRLVGRARPPQQERLRASPFAR